MIFLRYETQEKISEKFIISQIIQIFCNIFVKNEKTEILEFFSLHLAIIGYRNILSHDKVFQYLIIAIRVVMILIVPFIQINISCLKKFSPLFAGT